jgi:ribonuclease D
MPQGKYKPEVLPGKKRETSGGRPGRQAMHPETVLVEERSGLKSVVEGLQGVEVVGVDLEADSLYHFKERVCLIQIAAQRTGYLIDPLQTGDLEPLRPLFARRDITKVFHGADYDIRSLYRDFGIEVATLFDTELASRFLGVSQTGLEAVVAQRLGIRLNKKFQRRDWSQRPLPAPMLEYAARDALLLEPLWRLLSTKLAEKGRLEWVREECELLSLVRPAEPDQKPLLARFKGAGKLDRRTLAVLEALLTLRRAIAEKKDRPLFKIIGNPSILRIAVAKPADLKQLAELKALSPKQISMYGRELLGAVRRAQRLPANRLPIYPYRKKAPLGMRAAARVKALKGWRDAAAQRLRLEPGLICNRSLLAAIAEAAPVAAADLDRIEGLRRWQKREFGAEILNLLEQVK